MEGLWSGFDSVYQEITSGRYAFEPGINDFRLRYAVSKDLARILEISDAELGKDYLDETFKDKITSDNTIFRVAESPANGLMGFCYSYISETEDVIKDLGINKLPKYSKISSKIAVLKTIAVKSGIQDKGIGSALMRDSLCLFENKNIESVYCLAWKNKQGINIGGLMKLYDFKLYEEIANFWTDGSKKNGYLCPECGNPCECAAVIYTKAL
ncbi:hypothetical protein [Saccharicrinis sp. 156]|uniref:hypothetical protein n=1 Tax=Saccharicrinis sp. 156 TaxID=3417574 RepID=UPI003D34D26D